MRADLLSCGMLYDFDLPLHALQRGSRRAFCAGVSENVLCAGALVDRYSAVRCWPASAWLSLNPARIQLNYRRWQRFVCRFFAFCDPARNPSGLAQALAVGARSLAECLASGRSFRRQFYAALLALQSHELAPLLQRARRLRLTAAEASGDHH